MAPSEFDARALDEALDAALAGNPSPYRLPDDGTAELLERLVRLAHAELDPAFVQRLQVDLSQRHARQPNGITRAGIGTMGPGGRDAQQAPWERGLGSGHSWRAWPRLALAACLLAAMVLGIAWALAARDEQTPISIPAAQPSTPAAGPRAILLVVDVSGSMSHEPLGGTTRIEALKAAAQSTLAGLEEGAWFGLLAFNEEQEWVVPLAPLAPADKRQQAERAIDAIRAEGGTEIFPALSTGIEALAGIPDVERHLVLLTDGRSRTGTLEAYQGLVESIGSTVIVSAVAIGVDADRELTSYLAEIGGGQYRYAETSAEIPVVLAELVGLTPTTPAADTPGT